MNDQAQTLRFLASNPSMINHAYPLEQTDGTPRALKSAPTRCLAITGGKGGIGKSNLAVNLALSLGALNKRVNLLDADFGLANADLLCGVSPAFHLGHVVSGHKRMDEIMVELSKNVYLIPGGSGIEELANLSTSGTPYAFRKLHLKLQKLEENLDFMIIDTAAGVAENVIGIIKAAEEVIVVATPEPTSIVDAYATIKTILKRSPAKQIAVVVNNVVGVGDAEQVFQQLNSATKRFLNREVEFLGMVPHDAQLVKAVQKQMPIVHYAPSAPAARAIQLIAKQLQKQTAQLRPNTPLPSFWNGLSQEIV